MSQPHSAPKWPQPSKMIRCGLSSPRNPQGPSVPQSTIDPHEDTKFLQPPRFADYRRKLRPHGEATGRGQKRQRQSLAPLTSFGLAVGEAFPVAGAGHRMSLGIALATLTVSTLLKLIPPAATKLVVDNIFPGEPLPFAERWNLPATGMPALAARRMRVRGVGRVARGQHLGAIPGDGDREALQVDLRKRVFEHAVRLPLHRVYTIKSGGVASILCEDAGGVGELVFSMLYNPWRAVIQFWPAWRCWPGSIGDCCSVRCCSFRWSSVTHRTWIGRIRPQFREIRRQRQELDSHATEAFGGMRVVRAFGRSRSETARFTAAET